MESLINQIEVIVQDGVGKVWEERSGAWRWAHPNGKEGIETSRAAAIRTVKLAHIEYD